ncbi:MAG: hypothetical protein LBB86_09455 [Oscillospiraceae bacterium]|jgi:hypothetical protein|nr:hypothetical protein [Oscillospiraceae bacterium]
MSMPNVYLPDNVINGDKPLDSSLAMNEVLLSIAAQEMAVAHVLNAEGEKMQLFADWSGPLYTDCTGMTVLGPGDVLHIDDSINDMIRAVNDLECMFMRKMLMVLSAHPGYTGGFTMQIPDACNAPTIPSP